jgi:RHS repeat-associated protein
MYRLFTALVIMLVTSGAFAVSPIPPYTMWPCDRNAPPGSPSACSTADANDCFSYGTYRVREALQYRNGTGRSTRSNSDEPIAPWGICSNFNQWCAQEPQIGSAAYDIVVNPDGGRDALFSIEYDFPDSYCQVYDDGPPCYASVFPPKHVIEIPPVRLMLVDAATNNIVYSVPAAFESGTWKPRVPLGCGAVNRTFRVIALAGGGFGGCTAKTSEVRVTISASETEPNVCYADKWCPGCTPAMPSPSAGKPIALGSGDVSLSQPLFTIDQPPLSLTFGLTYHSERPVYPQLADSPLGFGWSHTFNDTLRRVDAHHTLLYRHDGAGHETHYEGRPGGPWFLTSPAELRRRQSVSLQGGRYILRDVDGTTTNFSAATGRWQSTTDRWGNSITATYNVNGFLEAIRDTMGREITITGASGTISAVTLPTGEVWRFEYQHGSLVRIFDPLHIGTTPWRSYEYDVDNKGRPRLLTAARDESGALLEGHDYDVQERGITSYSHDGRDKVTVTYTAAGHTRVTTSIGDGIEQQSEYTMRYKGGRWLPTKIVGSCSSCGASSAQQTFMLDDSNRPLTRTDGSGHSTRYSYDYLGNLTSRTDAAGTGAARTTLYFYDYPAWRTFLTRIVEPSTAKPGATKTTTFSWNADETVLTRAESGWLTPDDPTPATYTTTATFDERHRVVLSDGPRTDVADRAVSVYYANDHPQITLRGRLRLMNNALGHGSYFADYDIYGTARETTDPNGVTTTKITDRRGRTILVRDQAVTGDVNEAIDYTTTTVYDGRDRLVKMTKPRGNGQRFQYEDGTNRLIGTIRLDATGNEIERHETILNDLGTRVRENYQRCAAPALTCSDWVTRRSVAYLYDQNNRLKEIRHPAPEKAASIYAYDDDGLLVSVQDENHTVPNTRYTYDAFERLASVTQLLAGAPGNVAVMTYGYDVMDNLISVTDPNGNTTRYTFDDFRRMTRHDSPVSGMTSYSYDETGNVVASTDPRGAVINRRYDALGRALTVRAVRGTSVEDVSFTYDTSTYGIGRIASMTDPAGGTSYDYERRGLLRRVIRNFPDGTFVTGYEYDANGNRSAVTYPSGRHLTYAFDHADRAFALTGQLGDSSTTYISASEYEPFGPMVSLVYGVGSLTRRTTYDSRFRVTALDVVANGEALAAYRYGHDATGNILAITDALDPRYNRSFAYDDVNRLIGAATGSLLWGTASWTYDPSGNRLSEILGPRTRSFNYVGHTSKVASVAGSGEIREVTHDASGNEHTVGLNAFTYSPRNMLETGEGLRYLYDGTGMRVAQIGIAPGPVVTEQPQSYSACPGMAVTLSIRASGATAYQWELSSDGVTWSPSAGANSPELAVVAGEKAYYRVVTSNAIASTTSASAVVMAVPLATEPASGIIFGDITRDGAVTADDARQLRAVLAAKQPLPVSAEVVDLNDDGRVDALDLALLTAYAAGNITCLPQFAATSPVALPATSESDFAPQATAAPAMYPRQYFFYSIEKTLLSHTRIHAGSGTPQVAADYIWFGGYPVAEERFSGTRFTIPDHLGTPFLQTTTSGSPVWRVEYEPFGSVWSARTGAAIDQRLRLPGQEYDDQIRDRAYNVFRWYRSAWGRYTQADPLGEPRAKEPSLYTYVGNRPTVQTDPFGLFAVQPSCDCSWGQYGNVHKGVAQMCAYLKKPKCAALLNQYSFQPYDASKSEPLGDCLKKRCTGDHPIYCAINTDPKNPEACGKTNPPNGAITLLTGEGTVNCYFEQGVGWGPVILHESIHSCGLVQESYGNDPYSKVFQKMMWTCAGVLD